MNQAIAPTEKQRKSLVAKFADRFSIEPEKMMAALKATAFKQRDGSVPTNEQMMALLVVADQYDLNPWTKEIYAFPDKNNGIVPVVGVDGWSRIINSHPQFDGMEYNYSENMIHPEGAKSECHEWMECVMYRKDRSRPITVREYLNEVYRPPFRKTGQNGAYTVDGPWQSHPKRFLRHKATIQCARLAFGFVGIYDPDEADRIIEMGDVHIVESETVRDEPKPNPEYQQESFDKSFPEWERMILEGSKTSQDIVTTLTSTYTLTKEQEEKILAVKPEEKKHEDSDSNNAKTN